MGIIFQSLTCFSDNHLRLCHRCNYNCEKLHCTRRNSNSGSLVYETSALSNELKGIPSSRGSIKQLVRTNICDICFMLCNLQKRILIHDRVIRLPLMHCRRFPPRFVVELEPHIDVVIGDDVKLVCIINDAVERVHWEKDGQKVTAVSASCFYRNDSKLLKINIVLQL